MSRLLQSAAVRSVLWLCVLGGASIQSSCNWSPFSNAPREIHTVAGLRRLRLDDLRGQVLVRIRGYITVSDPVWNVSILQDEAGNGARLQTTDFAVPVHQLVEVTGFAVAAGNTPTIGKPAIKWLSMQRPPEPRRIKLDQLLDPAMQYTQVVVQGVFRAIVADRNNRVSGLMRVRDMVLHVRVADQSTIDVASLVDDSLEIKGVVEASYDIFGKATNPVLWVVNGGDITQESSARALSALQIRSIKTLADCSLEALPQHRVRVHGQVFTDTSGSKLFVKDTTGVMSLELAPSATLSTGDDLDVTGFLLARQGKILMSSAFVARLLKHQHSGDKARTGVLTSVAQLHSLTAEEASREYPVHLRGIVTYFDPKYGMLFVQDATGGTFVQAHNLQSQALRAGQIADVTGVSQAGFFAPELARCAVHLVGTGKLPKPGRVSEEIYTGKLDSDWVQAEGIVQSITREAGHSILHLESGVHRFDAEMLGGAPWAESLINSSVAVQGVAGSRFNRRKQLLGIIVWIASSAQVRVIWRAPAPASLPVIPIAQLLQFSPTGNADAPVRLQGVVTDSAPEGPTYIQDPTGSVVISNHRAIALRPGDVVGVLGFARLIGFSPAIQDGVLTKTGAVPPPAPVHVSADEALEGDFDSQLVELEATLLDRVINQTGETLMLQSGRTLFNATVEPGIRLATFRSGAVLRLTGVCSVQSATVGGVFVPRTLTLLLRSADDVTVLKREPWWSLEHALQLMAIVAGFALLASAWGLVLRHRVQRQTSLISEKLTQEQHLKLAAQAASRAKSEFLAVMSHEIRTPMNGVVGMTSLLLDTPLNEEQTEFVSTIRSSGSALMTIINDILDFSKIEAGKLDLEQIEFNMRELIQQSLGVVAVSAREKNLTLHAHIAERLECDLIGDPARLRQILLNLLSNAVKFSHDGSVTLRLEQEHSDQESQTIFVSIADTGIGISRAQQARLFERFSQADTSNTRKFGGTGLGLAISKRLIEQMNGSIGVESDLKAGSTFWFRVTLPISKNCPRPIEVSELPAGHLLSA